MIRLSGRSAFVCVACYYYPPLWCFAFGDSDEPYMVRHEFWSVRGEMQKCVCDVFLVNCLALGYLQAHMVVKTDFQLCFF